MKRKVVTICGPVRFWNKIQEMSERLELENEYAVIGINRMLWIEILQNMKKIYSVNYIE